MTNCFVCGEGYPDGYPDVEFIEQYRTYIQGLEEAVKKAIEYIEADIDDPERAYNAYHLVEELKLVRDYGT
jgi:hypothetical protein